MKNKNFIILLFLFLFGALLRLLWLGNIPAGFFRDEAALGYNAYSILQTGKDEFGMRFPIVFRSFEVFFLPLYVYLSALLVGVLGLSEFSSRLLSSISGIAALGLIYYITRDLWGKKAGLFSVLVLAISPWHIFYSRGAFEGNLALTLFAAGFLFWLRFLKNYQKSAFFASTFFFALSMYSYQAERLVVVLFSLVAIILSYKKLWILKGKLVFPVVAVLILLIPLLSLTFKPGGYHRAFGVSIFSKDPPGWIRESKSSLLVNNKTYLRARQVSALYLSYFSPRNLFIVGDADKQRSVGNFSTFYAWTLPFMLYGIALAVKRKRVGEKLLLSWMLISPLPAALTGDPFHTYRSLLMFFPLSVFVGLGLAKVYVKLSMKYKRLFVLGVSFVSFVSLVLFLFSYTILNQAARARDWDYGYKQIYEFVKAQDAEKIVVDDIRTEAYIYFLFFGRIDPSDYQKEAAKLGNVGEYYYSDPSEIRPNKFGRYEFRTVDWPKERGDSGTIFVMTAQALPESEFVTDPKVKLLKEIVYPNGKIAYRIVRIL